MKKEGDMIVFELAHREGDYVTIDKDGMDKIANLLGLASRRRKEAFAKQDCSLGTWNATLIEQDKIMTELFRSAKEIRIKVDWDKWHKTDQRISRELKRVNR